MNYKNLSDEALLQYCRKDNMQAFNELFNRYVGKLHRMGLRYVKDECVVEELTTDILLNLWLRRMEINLEGKLSSYLFQAMHNKAISFLRKSVPVVVDIRTLPEEAFVADMTADHRIVFKDTENTLEKMVAQLSPQRQKVFRLSREKNMSYAEIADEMNLSQNTVKHYMNAALECLRQQYQDIAVGSVIIILMLSFIF